MTTQQNNTAALTEERLEGVAGGLSPIPSLRPIHIIDPIYIIDPAYLPRPHVGPCVMTYQAGVDVTITEASGNIGMRVTSVVVCMYNWKGLPQVDKTLSASEIASQWGGSNHLGPGETRVVHYQSAFPRDAHPEDETADVTVTIIDDAGNITTLEQKNIDQLDKC